LTPMNNVGKLKEFPLQIYSKICPIAKLMQLDAEEQSKGGLAHAISVNAIRLVPE